jgi:hypothetical protein
VGRGGRNVQYTEICYGFCGLNFSTDRGQYLNNQLYTYMQGCPFDIETPTHWNPISLTALQPCSISGHRHLTAISFRQGKWYDFISFILKNCSSLEVYAPIIELWGLLLLTDAPTVYAVRLISGWKSLSRAVLMLHIISAPLFFETPLILLILNLLARNSNC